MNKIIELAHLLGEAISESEEMQSLAVAKDLYEKDAALQASLSEYETDRKLLGEEFAKAEGEADERAIADLRARMEEIAAEVSTLPHYTEFVAAQKAVNELMAAVNAEIRYCITGERPSDCTHDCSTCGGCSH